MCFKNKFLSLIICAVMLMTMPLFAFAEGENTDTPETSEEPVSEQPVSTPEEPETQPAAADDSQQQTSATQTAAKNNRSSNSLLSSLSITGVAADGTKYEIELNPQFNSKTYSYSISVPYEVERLEVSAVAQDQNANISIPEKYLIIDVGDKNTTFVNVTAQNGNRRQYKISTLRNEQAVTEPLTEISTETETQTAVQAAVTITQTTTSVAESESAGMNVYTKLGIVFSVGAAAFLILSAVLFLKKHKITEGE